LFMEAGIDMTLPVNIIIGKSWLLTITDLPISDSWVFFPLCKLPKHIVSYMLPIGVTHQLVIITKP
jgi:hypothetical protein